MPLRSRRDESGGRRVCVASLLLLAHRHLSLRRERCGCSRLHYDSSDALKSSSKTLKVTRKKRHKLRKALLAAWLVESVGKREGSWKARRRGKQTASYEAKTKEEQLRRNTTTDRASLACYGARFADHFSELSAMNETVSSVSNYHR